MFQILKYSYLKMFISKNGSDFGNCSFFHSSDLKNIHFCKVRKRKETKTETNKNEKTRKKEFEHFQKKNLNIF